ncbi:unnamed protein product [Nesidiocoris tenuis]|nr:unnamed protein product [Nesidiocoris tenuis]
MVEENKPKHEVLSPKKKKRGGSKKVKIASGFAANETVKTPSSDTKPSVKQDGSAPVVKKSNEPQKKSSKFANVDRKHSTGATNWQKFLQEVSEKGPEAVKPMQTIKHTSSFTERPKPRPPAVSKDSTKPKLTNVVAMDCEMVGIGEGGRESVLARVSIVNMMGECLYDKFVKPREPVTDYRTHVSGVRKEDVENAEEFEVVQKEVAEILRGRILVGHSIKNDLEVLFLSHPRQRIRDTAKFFRKGGARTPSLKNLANQYLDVTIQEGEHSSVQDARAAVQLYNMYRKQWEVGGGARKFNRIDTHHQKIRPVQNAVDDT